VKTRSLGDGGPEVSIVGLGTNNFGPRIDLMEARAVLETALEEGVTLVDTANVYGQGTSEQYIGEVLDGRLDRVVVATKFGLEMRGEPDVPRGSREYIRWAVQGSLERLRAETIDVYQMHQPDTHTPIEETLAALTELVDEGYVRFIGSSNFSAEQIEDADRVARDHGFARFVSAQNEYSLVHREIESDVLPACERLGIGVLPYFPLASGLLTGKYHRGERATEGRLAGRDIADERWEALERLQRFAGEHGISLLELAIGGLLAMPAITSVIAGATKPEQVRANVRAGRWEPSADDGRALRNLV
jgi:aryl-alcohol dehydrogenase-like predicted oxidoreductase